MTKSLTDKTISGLNWSFLSNNLGAVINVIVGVALARLLVPQDFGLLGMTNIFIGFALLFMTLGMGPSIQQIKNLTEEHIRVATTINIISSIILFLIFWFLAPLMAEFYKEERIIPILRALSPLFIIQGLATVSYAQIRREIDFKYILKIDLVSSILYGILTSTLAFLGFGVWSLVYGRIASTIIGSFLTVLKFPLNLKLLIQKKEFRELAGFGSGFSLSEIILYASYNIDYLIIGKFLNPYKLGLYTRAFNLMTESINKMTGGIYSVLFPAFAAVQDSPEKLRRAYFRTIKTVTFIVCPVLASMIVTAEFIIKGLFGAKWAGAITSFQILAAAGILRATLSQSGAIAQATGKIFIEATQQFIYLLILGGCVLYAVSYGIEGVALAVVFANLWLFGAQSWLALKIIDSNWNEFFNSMIPGLVNLILMVFVNTVLFLLLKRFFYSTPDEIKLISIVIVNIAVFVSLIVFLPFSIKGDTIDWLIEKYRRYIPSSFIKFYLSFNAQK